MRTREECIVQQVMDRYGVTFCQRAGIQVERGTPAPLFQLLCAALMFSAPIRAENVMSALRSLLDAGLSTPDKMAGASWQQRVAAITDAGYERYDEKTARQLGELAERVLDEYHGDLRELRLAADHEPAREKQRLMAFNGIGNVGADVFLREVQGAWDEVYPYTDARVLEAAARLGLGEDVETLAALVPRERFAAFAASLVQTDLDGSYEELRQAHT